MHLVRSCDELKRYLMVCRKEELGRGTAMASNMVVALVVWSLFCGTVVQAQNFDFFYFVQQVGGFTMWQEIAEKIEQYVDKSFFYH